MWRGWPGPGSKQPPPDRQARRRTTRLSTLRRPSLGGNRKGRCGRVARLFRLLGPITPEPQTDQREREGRDDRRSDKGGGGGRMHVADGQGERGYGHHQRQLSRAEDPQRGAVAAREDAAVEQQGWDAANDQEQSDEQRHLQERDRGGEKHVGVERHPAGDEEEQDEKAVADRRELRVEHLDLVAAQREPRDHSRNEAAEQEIEAELCGERDEAEHQYDGESHRELARGL